MNVEITENIYTITVEETNTIIEVVEEVVSVISVAEQGPAGIGIPPGGQAGQFIIKNSSNPLDASWGDVIDGGTFN